MRRGIFGGSFDPIHVGHLAAARAVRAARGLERVYVVPSARPPHKPRGCIASFEQRVAMARLATEGDPVLEVLDAEGRRPGRSYTVDTVRELREAQPGVEFDLLVGSDMLADLPGWRRAQELVGLVAVVAFSRPDADPAAALPAFRAAFPGVTPVWVDVPPVAVSATAVRRRLERGESLEGWVPPGVAAYIDRNRVYKGG
ncbi:MAG: nicotinate-nucleotide adenylyltransferase [Planctomycetota bacterium]